MIRQLLCGSHWRWTPARGPLRRRIVPAALVAGMIFLPHLAARGGAQDIDYPPPPSTAADAAASFDARREAIVRYNACGRERDFEVWYGELKAGNRDRQGEDLTAIVNAKIAYWYTFAATCSYTHRGFVPDHVREPCVQRDLLEFAPPLGNEARVRDTVPRDCLKGQINRALLAYAVHGQLGSSKLPCVGFSSVSTTQGEYDVALREIVRALYFGAAWPRPRTTPVLDPPTVQHITHNLLTARGSPGAESYSALECGNQEHATGSAADYADDQDWLDRSLDSIGDALEYLFKRLWILLIIVAAVAVLAGLAGAGAAATAAAATAAAIGGGVVMLSVADTLIRIPESENHLLNIESSRFLTNQLMLVELGDSHPNVDVIREQQADVREWLLKRLKRISDSDFEEYNARPYQRYSINAIVNLVDFSFDAEVERAARIVLDQASAKFAVGSNRARRVAPYRRLASADPFVKGPDQVHHQNLYNFARNSDHQVMRFIVLAGQTQLFPAGRLPAGMLGELVNPAISRYRLPDPILELAVERRQILHQRISHHGWEAYTSAPSFLLSAGGIQTPYANKVLVFGNADDKGIAVPTVLIPTAGATRVAELIRFDGVGIAENRSNNTCVWDGFACGRNLVIPLDFFSGCIDSSSSTSGTWTFINSARCTRLAGGPHFYVAAYRRDCSWNDAACAAGGLNSGILEVVDAPAASAETDAAYDTFKKDRRNALVFQEDARGGTYTTVDGSAIAFDARDADVISVNGLTIAGGAWGVRVQPAIRREADGLVSIWNARTKKQITIDFRDWNSPKWSIQP